MPNNHRYVSHLSKDRRLKKLIESQSPFRLEVSPDVHHWLCASIMSQQLSTRVATVIRQRFLELFEGTPTPRQVLDIPKEALRRIGISNAKAAYLHNVARFALEESLDLKLLSAMGDEELIQYLTRIKGVGRWTAEMLLMFSLGREDVFAAGDLGIQQAMVRLYKLDGRDPKKLKEEMLVIAARWSPYRTFACLHLWEWKDNAPLARPKAKKPRKKKART